MKKIYVLSALLLIAGTVFSQIQWSGKARMNKKKDELTVRLVAILDSGYGIPSKDPATFNAWESTTQETTFSNFVIHKASGEIDTNLILKLAWGPKEKGKLDCDYSREKNVPEKRRQTLKTKISKDSTWERDTLIETLVTKYHSECRFYHKVVYIMVFDVTGPKKKKIPLFKDFFKKRPAVVKNPFQKLPPKIPKYLQMNIDHQLDGQDRKTTSTVTIFLS